MDPLRLVVAALATLAAATLARADVTVIAHASVKLTGAEVAEVFKGDKQFAGSVKLVPVDNSAVQDEFLKKVLSVDHGKYESIWTKKSFREGLNPPAVKSGDAAVVDFVKQTPGAVGYVGSAPSGVQVIQKY